MFAFEFDDKIDRSDFADKSKAALARESSAKAKFDAIKSRAESSKSVTSFALLNPSEHLTDACFKDFRKYVLQNVGWKVCSH